MSQQFNKVIAPMQSPIQMARGSIQIMPSSWIREVRYDFITGALDINMRGVWYGTWTVSNSDFNKFILGRATCVTDDPTGRNRWKRGKYPSIGAAFHKYIKIGGGPSQIRRVRAALTTIRTTGRGRVRTITGRR